MGRHSLPRDPDDSVDEPAEDSAADDYTGRHLDADDGDGGDDDFADQGFPVAEDRYSADDALAADPTDDDYPDFPARPTSAAGSAAPPTPPRSPGSSRRVLGDWRGGHRSDGGRRGVSIGVIVALIAVVVVVGTVIV